MDDAPDFATWSYDALAVFAKAAYTGLVEKEQKLMALQQELKDCQARLAKINQLDDDWR